MAVSRSHMKLLVAAQNEPLLTQALRKIKDDLEALEQNLARVVNLEDKDQISTINAT
jgi:hypothetical protein